MQNFRQKGIVMFFEGKIERKTEMKFKIGLLETYKHKVNWHFLR